MSHTPYTTTDFIAAMERELIKRSTTYPRIVAKKQKQNVSNEEIMDIVATQRLQYDMLKYAVAALMQVMEIGTELPKSIYDELRRELKMRKKCYKRWVYFKRMAPEVADYETAVWAALVEWWGQNYCTPEKQEV